MQINIAIKNTISVIRVKEVSQFVKYHSCSVVKILLFDIINIQSI